MQSKNKPIVAVVYGLPGSGKSTFVRSAVSMNPDSVSEVLISGRFEKFIWAVRFILANPSAFIYWLRMLMANSDWQLVRYKLNLLVLALAKEEKARAQDGGIVLIDEGLYQRILSVFEDILSKDRMLQAFQNIPRPDYVFVLEKGNFSRFSAAEDRVNSPRFRKGEAYMRKWQSILRENDILLKSMFAGEGIDMLEADASHISSMVQGDFPKNR